jgi:hypothetical protein
VRGVEPHFELWKYFFAVSLQKKREKKGEDLPIYLKNDATLLYQSSLVI